MATSWVSLPTAMRRLMRFVAGSMLKKVVDKAVADYQKSGQAQKDYAKWFQKPIPALNGVNMDFPPSAEMAALWKAPNDNADVQGAK